MPLKSLIRSLSKRQPDRLSMMGVTYRSPSKPQPEKSSLSVSSSKRDKHTVAARRLFKDAPFEEPYKRKTKKHGDLVEAFFEEKATHIPGKLGIQKRTMKARKILNKSVLNLHSEFIAEHGSLISKATFFRRRPKHVLSFTRTPFRQCLCDICLNPMLKAKVVNNMLCNDLQISTLKNLIGLTICEGNRVECLKRLCKTCGVGGVDSLLQDCDMSKDTSWQRWERVEKGNNKFRLDLVKKQGSVSDLVAELKGELQKLPMHDFVHHWQSQQFSTIIKDIPDGWAVLVLDFAENYLCRQQDQPQSAYFSYSQVTVHPCVLYYGCACGQRVTDNWVFLSDVLSHSADMVKTIITRILHHLTSMNMKKVVIFSDGCAAQYKSKVPFFHLLSYDNLNIEMERCFYGARHGKNPCDSLGGLIKQSAARAVQARQCVIQNASDLHQFCDGNLKMEEQPGSCCHLVRRFHLLADEDIGNTPSSELKTLPGTRAIHSLLPTQTGLLTRNLSCFCNSCQRKDYQNCDNAYYVENWKKVASHKLSGRPTSCLNDGFLQGPDDSLPPPSPPDFIPVSREVFFRQLQDIFAACATFSDFVAVCKENTENIRKFQLPDITPKTVCEIGGTVDVIARNLLLHGGCGRLEHLFPVVTTGDGNCVPRALSVHCFGHQDGHVEIRCRIVHELALNALDYTCLEANDLKFLCELSDCNSGSLHETFQREVMLVSKNAIYMGLWQIMAAANCLGADILSIYPSLGPTYYRQIFNRTIRSQQRVSSHVLPLLWSSTQHHSEEMPSEYWTANHVVPLLAMNVPTEVTVEDFEL